jgi:hypothetical protein
MLVYMLTTCLLVTATNGCILFSRQVARDHVTFPRVSEPRCCKHVHAQTSLCTWTSLCVYTIVFIAPTYTLHTHACAHAAHIKRQPKSRVRCAACVHACVRAMNTHACAHAAQIKRQQKSRVFVALIHACHVR